jgi:predicted small integral membrane protein
MQDGCDDEEQEVQSEEKPLLSYTVAMSAFAILAILSFFTLHGDALYISLLIVAALALKTWLTRVKSRLE